MTIGNWFKKNASTILTCIGASGMITTVVLAIKATPKAMVACTDAQAEKGQKRLTKLEVAKAAAPAYISTVAVGVGSLVCIFGANALSRKQQASLISAYATLEQAFEAYREKVVLLSGEVTDRMAMRAAAEEKRDDEADNPPWETVQTFYLEGYPSFFEATMERVATAEYCLNRNFTLRGYATFNEFLHFLGLEDIGEKGERIGWEEYIGEAFYGYRWIDFDHIHRDTDDGLRVCDIEMPFSPHPLDDSDWKDGHSVPVCGVD